MGTNIRRRPNPPTNVAEIQDALRDEWAAIPLQLIRRLILSMRRRCQAVIQAQGGHTKYWQVELFMRINNFTQTMHVIVVSLKILLLSNPEYELSQRKKSIEKVKCNYRPFCDIFVVKRIYSFAYNFFITDQIFFKCTSFFSQQNNLESHSIYIKQWI